MQLNSKSPEVAISGWLLKRCPAFGPDHWNKQWCVLYEDEDQDSWALDCYSDESARRKICHIVLGFAARVLPINSKHVPAVLAKLQYQRPCSFVLDSGEGRLCPFYVFDAVQKESLNSWQQAVSSCARDLTRRQKTQDEQDRAELIAEIFALLNPSGSGCIWKEEFRRYAETLGFWGSEGEWNTEFWEICEDRGWKEEKGITVNHFTKFLSKDPDLSREELVELIEALQGKRDVPISDSWARQSVASNLVKLRTRSDVVNALFNCLQCKDTGRIGSQELQRYAKLSGFDGDDDDWAEEYEDLCAEQGWNKEQGLSRAEFSVLMNDDAMGADEELKAILMELRMPQKRTMAHMSQWAGKSRVRREVEEMPRDELINEAFTSLDVLRKNLLGSREFRRYAELTGYDGGDEFWDEQYQELCEDYGWTPDVGVNKEQFIDFIGDESNSTDEELRELVSELRLRQDVAARRFRSAVRRIMWMLRYAGFALAKGDYQREDIQKMSRKQLADAVFHSLDRRQRQALDSKAMRVFANATGFYGDDDDWASEFHAICDELGWDEERGVSKSQFHEFIGDESSTSSESLRILLFNLPAVDLSRASVLMARGLRNSFVETKMGRAELIDEIYQEMGQESATVARGTMSALLGVELDAKISRARFLKLIGGEEKHSTPLLRKTLLDLRKQQRRDSVYSQTFANQWQRKSLKMMDSMDPSSMSREELIDAIFHALDGQHQETLDSSAIRIFAEETRFDEDDEEWEEQFAAMSEHFGWENVGISRGQFNELVNNDDDTSDDELRTVLSSLHRRFQRPSLAASRRASSLPWLKSPRMSRMSEVGGQVDKMDRNDLINAIFASLCEPSKFHLDSKKLRVFAERTGFDGDDAEWAERFELMCEEFAWTAPGVSQAQFEEFLGDEVDYTDDELRRVLLSLRIQNRPGAGSTFRSSGRSSISTWSRKSFQEPEAMNRKSLIEAIFRCLDSERRKVLTPDAIRIFAEETGFEGNDQEWQEQYHAMSEFFGWQLGDSESGITPSQFAELVDNDEDTTESELRQVLEKLLAERRRTSRASVSSASVDPVDPVDPVDTWKRQSFVRSQDSHSRAELSDSSGRSDNERIVNDLEEEIID